MEPIVLLSGPIAAGKSTICAHLVESFGFQLVKTNELLRMLGEDSLEFERIALQEFGEYLDRTTSGDWVRLALLRKIEAREIDVRGRIIVDSVRIREQIQSLRRAFGNRIVHIHLTAPNATLEKRFKHRRKRKFKEAGNFAETQKNPTEIAVRGLSEIADVVVNTDRCVEQDIVTRVASHLGFFGGESQRLVDVMIGGQYGSEGKGHLASFLAPEYDILMRVGGPNAGHKVFHPPYTFHHLPSGTFHNDEAKLVIGPGAVLNLRTPKGQTRPKGLIEEIAECGISQDRLVIDPHAMIIEPEDIRNERSLVVGIASTGVGVGYATARRIVNRQNYIDELTEIARPISKSSARLESTPVRLAKDIKELRPFVRSSYEELERAYAAGKKVFLEGTQGTALSLYHGHYPHVTSRDTTVAGCLAEAGISSSRVRKAIMVCRTYPIRVGDAPDTGNTSGYMSQPITLKEIARRSGIPYSELRKTERTSTTNRPRRIAEFDWVLLRRAATLNAPTDIALSFADYLNVKNRDARRFEQLDRDTINFIAEVEAVASARVSLISTRFEKRSIIDRRTW